MTTIMLIAAVCIIVILFFPTEKMTAKKPKIGTVNWENKMSMRIAQFTDYIYRKIKDLIGG